MTSRNGSATAFRPSSPRRAKSWPPPRASTARRFCTLPSRPPGPSRISPDFSLSPLGFGERVGVPGPRSGSPARAGERRSAGLGVLRPGTSRSGSRGGNGHHRPGDSRRLPGQQIDPGADAAAHAEQCTRVRHRQAHRSADERPARCVGPPLPRGDTGQPGGGGHHRLAVLRDARSLDPTGRRCLVPGYATAEMPPATPWSAWPTLRTTALALAAYLAFIAAVVWEVISMG